MIDGLCTGREEWRLSHLEAWELCVGPCPPGFQTHMFPVPAPGPSLSSAQRMLTGQMCAETLNGRKEEYPEGMLFCRRTFWIAREVVSSLSYFPVLSTSHRPSQSLRLPTGKTRMPYTQRLITAVYPARRDACVSRHLLTVPGTSALPFLPFPGRESQVQGGQGNFLGSPRYQVVQPGFGP